LTTYSEIGTDGGPGAAGTSGIPDGGAGDNGEQVGFGYDFFALHLNYDPIANGNTVTISAVGGDGGTGGGGFGNGAGGAGGFAGYGSPTLTNVHFNGSLGVNDASFIVQSIGGAGGNAGANGSTAPATVVAGAGSDGAFGEAGITGSTFQVTSASKLSLKAEAQGGSGGAASPNSVQALGGSGGTGQALLGQISITGALTHVELTAIARGGDGAASVGSSNYNGFGGHANSMIVQTIVNLSAAERIDISLVADAGDPGPGSSSTAAEAGIWTIDVSSSEFRLGNLTGGTSVLRIDTQANGRPILYSDPIAGIAGNIFDGGSGDDTLEFNTGTLNPVSFDMSLNTVTGFELIRLGNSADRLIGDDNPNLVAGHGGNDFLYGKGGIDTSVYYGVLANYAVTRNYSGNYTITDLRPGSPGGTDTLFGFEKIQIGSTTYWTGVLAGGVRINGTAGNDIVKGIVTVPGQPLPTANDDVLFGLGGNDTLDGGLGGDIMFGGPGNDTYEVDDLADLIIEEVSQGTDTIRSSVDYDLPLNVENLTLTGNFQIYGAGNSLANVITGNSQRNILEGLAGADTIDGGGGNDDMYGGKGNDRIELSSTAFASLAGYGLGALSAGELTYGTAATGPGQHLIYDGATGSLYYDSDANGGAAKILLALLTGTPVLNPADIFII
jgi:hypothetical protein